MTEPARDAGRSDLWIVDLVRGVRSRFTSPATSGAACGDKTPLSVSRDGRFLLFRTRDGLWSRTLDGSGTEASFLTSAFTEEFGPFSKDGRWVAYASDESGRFQIYVRAFPAGDQVVQVSRDGGDIPRWSPDGRELYFFHAGPTVAASVTFTGGALEVTSVTPLFECRPPDGFRRLFYDVAPDGRFLMMSPISTPGPTPLTLLVNWRALMIREK